MKAMPESLGAMFAESARTHGDRVALKARKGSKPQELSYADFWALVREFGCGLISLGVAPSDRVFILSDNCPEWLVADLAILSIGAVNVSRGSDSTVAEVEYIFKHSSPVLVVVENRKQLEKLTFFSNAAQLNIPTIVLDDSVGREVGRTIYGYSDIIAQGRKIVGGGDNSFDERLKEVKHTDLATIVYTSGTTGAPKGVMLTHQNLISNVEATLKSIHIVSDDRLLSILPSWHTFERTVEYVAVRRGACIVYTNPRTIGKDMIAEKPTYFAAVPRIWELFYERVSKKLKERKGFARAMITFLLDVGRRYILEGRVCHNTQVSFRVENFFIGFLRRAKARLVRLLLYPAYWLGQRLVFNQVSLATGGSLKAGISGGGSFPAYLDDFFEMAGIPILNGYGLTETSPIVSVRTVEHNVRGTIGRVIEGTAVRIVDEGGNDVTAGDQGVLWIRGPQIMKGYYKNEEATGKVMKEGGWFDSGDLGRMTVTGDLVITGRAKDTIVLFGGENVEPEPIETVLRGSEYIENVMVVGQDKKYLAALIYPNYQAVADFLGEENTNRQEMVKESSVNELIRRELASRINEANGFKQHEKIIKCTLVEDEWTRENGLLTPTLKLKRNVITERYREVIEKMYAQK